MDNEKLLILSLPFFKKVGFVDKNELDTDEKNKLIQILQKEKESAKTLKDLPCEAEAYFKSNYNI